MDVAGQDATLAFEVLSSPLLTSPQPIYPRLNPRMSATQMKLVRF